jgi:hypothetical protein
LCAEALKSPPKNVSKSQHAAPESLLDLIPSVRKNKAPLNILRMADASPSRLAAEEIASQYGSQTQTGLE